MKRDEKGKFMKGSSGWHHSKEAKLKMKTTQFKKGHKINFGRKMPQEGVKKAVESRRLNNGYQSMVNKIKERMTGKTYEEIYGNLKAANIKKKLRIACSEEKRIKIKNKRKLQIFPIKDTSIEVKIQKFLTQLQIEYFTHKYMHIEHGYQCDIFIPVQKGIMQKTIIECDGDYWHGNPLLYKEGKLNEKQKQQQRKDNIRTQELIKKGFRVIRLWETEINNMKCYDLNNIIK